MIVIVAVPDSFTWNTLPVKYATFSLLDEYEIATFSKRYKTGAFLFEPNDRVIMYGGLSLW